jgi:hypothetical protein
MTLATEQMHFGRSRRMDGLESSRIALDVLQGKDTAIEYSDYLNVAKSRPELPKVTLHEINEVRFGC